RSHMPVVGIIENMSGNVFGEGGGKSAADELGVPLLGSIPLDQAVVDGSDTGHPVVLQSDSGPPASALAATTNALMAVVPPADLETCTGRIAKLIADLEDGAV
ncbi:MAG TPA: P-loop NTPase, partial [Acidimicrobiia bacterium]|nr:P-loop NTPase [Acidimicrobiia bacterium]